MNYDTYQANIFAQATQYWKLEELYAALDKTKQQVERKQLTSLEQAILRGILSGHSTEKIASFLSQETYGLIINSTWRLYRYIQILTASKTFNNYKNIPDLLETAGYKKSRSQQKLDHFKANSAQPFLEPLEESAEQIVQGGNQSLATISLPPNTALGKSAIASPTTKIISIKEISRQTLSEQSDTDTNEREICSDLYSNTALISKKEPQNPVSTSITPYKAEESALTVQTSASSEINNLSFAEADDFMPPISLWAKLGGMFMMGSIGVVIALSAFTPYNVTVKAQAKVRPAGELRIVQAETEGTVININAKSNQKVKKGDILATIDTSRLETKKSQLENNIQESTLKLHQIKAQITAQKNRIEAETRGINRAIASARVQLTRSRREHQDRRNTANAQVDEAIANFNSTQEELNQAKTELISLKADLKSAQASLNGAKYKRDRYTIISQSGALSQNQLEETQLDVEQKEQQVISQQAAIQRQNQEIARRKQAIAAAKARLNNSQVALNPSHAEVEIALENIEREKALGQANLSSLKREQEALVQQQIEIQQQQARNRQELQQLEKDLERNAIKATADGILFQLNLRNSGQTVALGETIAQIAPLSNSLVIKALVPAQEIDKVETDQAVQMKVSACPYPDYGTLKGVVSKIAPDSITPQNYSASDNSSITSSPNLEAGFYQVKIKPESLALGHSKKQCTLQLGMEGQVDIIAQEETVLKFLLRKARLITDL